MKKKPTSKVIEELRHNLAIDHMTLCGDAQPAENSKTEASL